MDREDYERAINGLVENYYYDYLNDKEFIPGTTHVTVTQKCFNELEMQAIVSSALDFNLTSGRFVEQFEKKLSTYVGTRYALATNSGSSANLLAILAASEEGMDEWRDYESSWAPEVITMAAGFPTTIAPIYQAGMVPHFVDITLPTYGVNIDQIEAAINDNTAGMIIAHTLGNPFEADRIAKLCQAYDLWLVEDCCDALGAKYKEKMVGTYGICATSSFYPAHHITTGEGGAVFTDDPSMKLAIESYRDWGRDCWCETGHDATCGKRYSQQFGRLPYGYDHKYVYTRLGYNLKMTEMQAAIGVEQMSKLSWFVDKRERNFSRLYSGISRYEEFFILPESLPDAEPSWFGFPITIRDGAPFTRAQLIDYLDKSRIDSRLLFAGNMTKQPALLRREWYAESLLVSDKIMNDTLWIGVHPSLTVEMIDYVLDTFNYFIKEFGA